MYSSLQVQSGPGTDAAARANSGLGVVGGYMNEAQQGALVTWSSSGRFNGTTQPVRFFVTSGFNQTW